ncbi:hypothetical protein F383_06986 [Gossypium arboreum]|uniref:Uncharacterized protein n=1 Tax=Gossypium arboreum TaxID=29729 RepID=A0A0B0PJK2_GOSAR|nr:hypothetical protein F383_06986 [Gossypium arboreum]
MIEMNQMSLTRCGVYIK